MIPHHLHLNMIAAMLTFRLGCQSLTPWLRQPNEGPCEPSAFHQGLSNLYHVSLWLRTVLCSAFDYTNRSLSFIKHIPSVATVLFWSHTQYDLSKSQQVCSHVLFFLLFFHTSFSCLCVYFMSVHVFDSLFSYFHALLIAAPFLFTYQMWGTSILYWFSPPPPCGYAV